MKKIVITGVTSFLGSYLAKRLINDGNIVYGVVRPTSKNIDAIKGIDGLNLISLDFDSCEDENALVLELRRFGITEIDVWVHFSWDGVGSVGRSDPAIQEKNLKNAKNSLNAAKLLGTKRFLFSGSQAEYGDGTKDKPNPKSLYGIAKLQFGNWAIEHSDDIEFVHMRIYSVYGVGDHPYSLVNTSVNTFLSGNTMQLGPCTQMWNYMFIRDCADAMAMLVETDKKVSGVYEIGSQKGKRLCEYVEDIWKICGEKGSYVFGERVNNAEGAVDLIPDISRLMELGFKERYEFDQGIKEIISSVER